MLAGPSAHTLRPACTYQGIPHGLKREHGNGRAIRVARPDQVSLTAPCHDHILPHLCSIDTLFLFQNLGAACAVGEVLLQLHNVPDIKVFLLSMEFFS